VEPQLFVSAKPLTTLPVVVTAMLPISTGVVPLFVTVTGCGMPARENVRDEGDSVTGPPDKANPAPVIGIVIEEFTAEFSITKEAFRGPAVEGVNVTCTAHVAPAGKPGLPGQFWEDTTKSAAAIPVIRREVIETGVAPLFVTISGCVDEKLIYAAGNVIAVAETDNPVGATNPTVQSAGATVNVGWYAAAPATSANRFEIFAVGLLAMFNPAPITFTGAVPPVGVAAVSNIPHVDPSPAAPPGEFTQIDRISASVLICAIGTVVPAGTFNPGIVPVETFA
jgi:hypothetical protein